MKLGEVQSLLMPKETHHLDADKEVAAVVYDSRKATPGALFVAIRGFKTDGHRFIEQAVQCGAVGIVCEALPATLVPECSYFVVPDSRWALAVLAKAFYGNVSDKLTIVGITGTNGKTTTSYLIKSILEANGWKTGLIGTVEYHLGDEILEAERTTPEAVELHQFFDKMVHAGCTHCVMEVSSHSLALQRTVGIRFQVAVFTNLSRDHLDFHGTMENYFRAKKRLFDSLDKDAIAITNADDAYSKRIVADCPAPVMTYGLCSNGAVAHSEPNAVTVSAKVLRYELGSTSVVLNVQGELHTHSFEMIGRFNLYNILAAYSAGLALGIEHHRIIQGISKCKGVRGRMEQVWSSDQRCAVIDYAHSPDALENVLRTLREVLPQGGRLIVLFGCGGDRDRGKRPEMGRIAEQLADVLILTSDNPRSEDPEKILDDIESGLQHTKPTYRITNRQDAIEYGISLLRQGDVLLVAGKGHETYQEMGGVRYPFDDRAVVEAIFQKEGKRGRSF
ncbi:MAG: UDP-N-acetylmuramoyl-L-alanyl-D-glutamate--2,6-diaminopimelate ligase [Chloroherpetonaceae bacterium]|nr:UDP-N-acetylmuramoyl-L-alanyl-D-glutamate--2,6-diaminopimelate ligase [Chloroherpetonaceae bacterium]